MLRSLTCPCLSAVTDNTVQLGPEMAKVTQAVIKTSVFVRFAAHLVRVWNKSRTSGKRTAGLMNVLWKLPY